MNAANYLFQFTETPGPTNLTSVADYLRASVEYDDLGPDVSGTAQYQDGSFLIRINNQHGHSDGRQRFTLAHECGHVFLHAGLLVLSGAVAHRDVFGAEKVNPPEPFQPFHETQANKFAASLLLPERRVRAWFDSVSKDSIERRLPEYAQEQGVSITALRWRLHNLGMR